MTIRFGKMHPLYDYMPRGKIIEELLKKYKSKNCRCIEFDGDENTSNLIIFTPEATHELINVFYWGQNHPLNTYEQQAGLVGHFFAESEQNPNCLTLVVSHVITAHCSERNPIGAVLLKEHRADLLDEIRILNENRNKSDFDIPAFSEEYALLGIVHSHPNDLDVFMSGTDYSTHMKDNITEMSYKITMIVNPHRKIMIAYGGQDIIQTYIQLMLFPEDVSKISNSQSVIKSDLSFLRPQNKSLIRADSIQEHQNTEIINEENNRTYIDNCKQEIQSIQPNTEEVINNQQEMEIIKDSISPSNSTMARQDSDQLKTTIKDMSLDVEKNNIKKSNEANDISIQSCAESENSDSREYKNDVSSQNHAEQLKITSTATDINSEVNTHPKINKIFKKITNYIGFKKNE
ncbi:MAG: hypothetical protein K5895_02090 [Lachnospiraceae bacterium]|nr:hypothetical protein [Lachnospiraceae bacterium]